MTAETPVLVEEEKTGQQVMLFLVLISAVRNSEAG